MLNPPDWSLYSTLLTLAYFNSRLAVVLYYITKMMQTTLDDVCMMVYSAVQNYIILGLSKMLLQSYWITLFGLI